MQRNNGKRVRADIEREVNLLYLDFLLYESTRRLLLEADDRLDGQSTDKTYADVMLGDLDSFMTIYHASPRPADQDEPTISEDLQFRHDLWQFTTLFARRLERDMTTPTATQLRSLERNCKARARLFDHSSTTWASVLQRYGNRRRNRIPTSPIAQTRMSGRKATWDTAGDTEKDVKRYIELTRPVGGDDGHGPAAMDSGTGPAGMETVAGPSSPDRAVLDSAFLCSERCLPLRSLLPKFMLLSATCSEGLDQHLTHEWMRLAIDFMTHAVLEDVLLRGAEAAQSVCVVFAWGFAPSISDPGSGAARPIDIRAADVGGEGGDHDDATMHDVEGTSLADEMDKMSSLDRSQWALVSDMFRDQTSDDQRENPAWTEIRARAVEGILGPANDSADPDASDEQSRARIWELVAARSVVHFERRLLSYLTSISMLTPAPVLAEVKSYSKNDGLRRGQIRRMIQRRLDRMQPNNE